MSVRAFDRERRAFVDVSLRGVPILASVERASSKEAPERFVVVAVTFAMRADAAKDRGLGAKVAYAELASALGVREGERAPMGDVRDAVVRLRRKKGMVTDASDLDSVSAGSFFVNPVLGESELASLALRLGDDAARLPRFPADEGRSKVSAAWLIERAGGFPRAHACGAGPRSRPSTRSPSPTAAARRPREVPAFALARSIQDGVKERFGVALAIEPVIVGDD